MTLPRQKMMLWDCVDSRLPAAPSRTLIAIVDNLVVAGIALTLLRVRLRLNA
jgi:hypothetical protein